jgi:hypothetical protein
MDADIKELVDRCIEVATLAGIKLSCNDIAIEKLSAPHIPPKFIPEGKMAIYIFMFGPTCLKVGKAGPRSKARFTNHHYSPGSSNSNLAKSLLKNRNQMGLPHLDKNTVKLWIRENTSRIHFLVDESVGMPILNLFESFLQCRLNPRFEGYESQKI